MGDDATMSKKKVAPGQYTHWARPRWIRMYQYNYEYGESYYRPQVRYMTSSSKYLSESEVATSLSATYSSADSHRAYVARRKSVPPPGAMSFIERWVAEPFYGRGYYRSMRASSMDASSRARSEYRSAREESRERESQYRMTRAESSERQSQIQSSEMRSRRAQSEMSKKHSSSYASDSLMQQINNVRATSVALQQESSQVQERLKQRRAQSLNALHRAEMDYYSATGASDDCLMRSDALDAARRSRREQSVLSDIEARYSREGSAASREELDASYEYPQHHTVCTERCPLFNDPVNHRRFVIGNRYNDAAALGGFDVLYDPTVYKKTRHLLSRLSEERDVESSMYQATKQSSVERGQSRSRYAYNTIY